MKRRDQARPGGFDMYRHAGRYDKIHTQIQANIERGFKRLLSGAPKLNHGFWVGPYRIYCHAEDPVVWRVTFRERDTHKIRTVITVGTHEMRIDDVSAFWRFEGRLHHALKEGRSRAKVR